MKVILAGATGLVGSLLLEKLTQDPNVSDILILGRKEIHLSSSKLKFIKTLDFNDVKISESYDAAFCCLGTTMKVAKTKESFFHVDHDLILNFAKFSKSLGVQKFITISAIGADVNSPFFYNQVKAQTETDLIKEKFQELVILRPSLLLGFRSEKRMLEDLSQSAFRFFEPILKKIKWKSRPVEAGQVAQTMLSSIKKRHNDAVTIISNDQILQESDRN